MYIGVDIGGTKCAVVLADGQGRICKKQRFDTTTRTETLKKILDAAESFGPAKAVGISCGGPLDTARGVILSPPNLPDWHGLDIVRMLGERIGAPAFLQNDANACALAEWQFGAGEKCDNMIFLTFGTGLGAGLILGGRLYEGANGNAGEVGHIRLCESGPVGFGKSGSFEGFCSGGGMAQLGRAAARAALAEGKALSFCPNKAAVESVTAKKMAECAEAGYSDAIEIYRLCGKQLGRGLSVLVDILNPDRIVIGSIYARSEQLLREAMYEELKKETLSEALAACKILPAALGDEIGDYAAISVAMRGKRGSMNA